MKNQICRAFVRDLEPATTSKAFRPSETGDENADLLYVTVVFTTVSATLDALRNAAEWAHQLGAQIQILVPYVVPYPLPLDRPRTDPGFVLRRFRTLCEQQPIETRIEIKLCRDVCDCLVHSLTPQALVLIGNGGRWWPFTREKHWARALRRAGHHVFLVCARP